MKKKIPKLTDESRNPSVILQYRGAKFFLWNYRDKFYCKIIGGM